MKKLFLFLICLSWLCLPVFAFADGADEYWECEWEEKTPITEDYDLEALPGQGWEVQSTHSELTWEVAGEQARAAFGRDNFAYVSGDADNPSDEYLMSEKMVMEDLFDWGSYCEDFGLNSSDISFFYAASAFTADYSLSVELCIEYQEGVCDWKPIWSIPDEVLAILPYQWVDWSVSLESVSYYDIFYYPFRIGFHFHGQGDFEVGIDDVSLTLEVECCWTESGGGGGSDEDNGNFDDEDDDSKTDDDETGEDVNFDEGKKYDYDDEGKGCGISPNQSSALLAGLMLAIGILAMVAGARKKK